jgi:hypothetical protein
MPGDLQNLEMWHITTGITGKSEMILAWRYQANALIEDFRQLRLPRLQIDPPPPNYATLDASGKCADAACGLFFGGND